MSRNPSRLGVSAMLDLSLIMEVLSGPPLAVERKCFGKVLSVAACQAKMDHRPGILAAEITSERHPI